MKNILESIGQGDCKACICNIIPQFCQEKNILPTKNLAKRTKLIKLSKSKQCDPDETTCPAGCCPMGPDWYCCPDDMWCAPTAAECPYVDKRVSLVKLANSKQCGPDETTCPEGCCPEANWYCCYDAYSCAPSPAECQGRTLFLFLNQNL